MTDKRREYDARLYEALRDPGHPTHGKTTGYRAGCRCRRCTTAQVQRQQVYRAARRG